MYWKDTMGMNAIPKKDTSNPQRSL
jgi:hypothetical protein